MVYVITAMYCEAAPIIKRFTLKKVTEIRHFQVFKNDSLVLIVSGVGPVKAAAATAFIFAYYGCSLEDILINIGICGSVKNKYHKNEILLCSKIIDSSTKFEYYPDLIFNSPFREAVLETFPKVVEKNGAGNVQGDIIDMEGAYIYGAASIFLYQHNIHIIKIVSDNMEPSSVSAEYIEKVIDESLDKIQNWIDSRKSLNKNEQELLSKEELEKIKLIEHNLNLSETMKIELYKLALNYKIRKLEINNELDSYLQLKCSSRKEGKRYFGEIRKRLMEL
ncbi:hypothetical protein [Clostridium oryzae]|uniref:5'-methylthioadenosine/S-adenosylhomocysteine nucleosidase n=1 Tax=Clostridium oryzae TaxID=1450648 RepID=A0A1V4IQI9_9CLOT|nr:hypothetical protein [Clostridium oryzae]OPJ62272.1 5'-methylthioadenosine/S-adenosylhomocysteine nucleosidase [Clostridium oryzae]